MITEIKQPIQFITNSSQNTAINNLSRKFRFCVCVCVCVYVCGGGGGEWVCACVCFRMCYTHNIAGHIIYEFYSSK